MGVSPIEIFKKLPKTNCGDCGVPTCMAFAVMLSQGKAELSKCPHVDKASAAQLSASSQPPVLPVTIGCGDCVVKIGGETVLFRHEKTFVSPPAIAVLLTDQMDDKAMEDRIKALNEYQYERVGLKLRANLVAVKSDDPDRLQAMAIKADQGAGVPIILISDNPDALKAAATPLKAKKPLLYAATTANADAVIALAKELDCPVAAKGKDMDDLIALTQKMAAAGLKNIVIDSGPQTIKQALQDQIQIRRQAVKKTFRPLGYPTIAFPADLTTDPLKEALYAGIMIAKYAGIIVLSDLRPQHLFPLLVQRMNIYTDPQRPMATQPGIYDLNSPTDESPLLVTSNFSLTYFIVSGELETSRMPSRLAVIDTEGLSVLTGWAAGKFAADIIAPAILKSGVGDKMKKKRLIIPGAVASISGELEEELPGWEIIIGPREAAHISAFLKELKN
jgi:acetyl-CoA decarbonylase/synthase, CODH/ACS complex subunit gamma